MKVATRFEVPKKVSATVLNSVNSRFKRAFLNSFFWRWGWVAGGWGSAPNSLGFFEAWLWCPRVVVNVGGVA